jgi:hypothetical protein
MIHLSGNERVVAENDAVLVSRYEGSSRIPPLSLTGRSTQPTVKRLAATAEIGNIMAFRLKGFAERRLRTHA